MNYYQRDRMLLRYKPDTACHRLLLTLPLRNVQKQTFRRATQPSKTPTHHVIDLFRTGNSHAMMDVTEFCCFFPPFHQSNTSMVFCINNCKINTTHYVHVVQQQMISRFCFFNGAALPLVLSKFEQLIKRNLLHVGAHLHTL